MMCAKLVQVPLWTAEIAGLSSDAAIFLGSKGKKYFNNRSMKKSPTILNANIFDAAGKKVWVGDIDVEHHGKALLHLAEKYGPIYILCANDEIIRGKKMLPRCIRQMATVVVDAGNILCSRDFAVKNGIIKKG